MHIYCSTKVALYSYSITLRQQLEGAVEVIEIAPPRVITELGDIPPGKKVEGLSVDEYVADVMKKLDAGETLITTGMSTKMLEMSRSDPEKIQEIMRQKGLKSMKS